LAALNKKDYKTLRKIADRTMTIPRTYTLDTLRIMTNYLDQMTQAGRLSLLLYDCPITTKDTYGPYLHVKRHVTTLTFLNLDNGKPEGPPDPTYFRSKKWECEKGQKDTTQCRM